MNIYVLELYYELWGVLYYKSDGLKVIIIDSEVLVDIQLKA
jgi:hypothetical protein